MVCSHRPANEEITVSSIICEGVRFREPSPGAQARRIGEMYDNDIARAGDQSLGGPGSTI